MKTSLIAEIEQIYRDAGYRRIGRSLEDYPEELLRLHLEKLQAGAFPWIKGRIKTLPASPYPPVPVSQ